MRDLKIIGGSLAIVGSILVIDITLLYLKSYGVANVSWIVFFICAIWTLLCGLWAITGSIWNVKYTKWSSGLPIASGIIMMTFGLVYYTTSDFTFFPFSFFVSAINLPFELWVFGISIESILILIGGILIFISVQNKKD